MNKKKYIYLDKLFRLKGRKMYLRRRDAMLETIAQF